MLNKLGKQVNSVFFHDLNDQKINFLLIELVDSNLLISNKLVINGTTDYEICQDRQGEKNSLLSENIFLNKPFCLTHCNKNKCINVISKKLRL